jgi:hypothetical protein
VDLQGDLEAAKQQYAKFAETYFKQVRLAAPSPVAAGFVSAAAQAAACSACSSAFLES